MPHTATIKFSSHEVGIAFYLLLDKSRSYDTRDELARHWFQAKKKRLAKVELKEAYRLYLEVDNFVDKSLGISGILGYERAMFCRVREEVGAKYRKLEKDLGIKL